MRYAQTLGLLGTYILQSPRCKTARDGP